MSKKYDYDDLCEIIDTLLGEGGCPWDRAQTHESLKTCLLEECYEVLDAIDQKNNAGLCEELGDVLLQVVFHGKLAEKHNEFTKLDITDGICRKLINRHPHIFESPEALSADTVLENWEEIKKREKGIESVTESMRLVPRHLPQSMRAAKLIKKAEKGGLAVSSEERSIAEIGELLARFPQNNAEKSEVLGDILFEIANIAYVNQINAEFALTNAIEKFINRFESFERRS